MGLIDTNTRIPGRTPWPIEKARKEAIERDIDKLFSKTKPKKPLTIWYTTVGDLFEKWWVSKMGDRMKQSKYLARKAWIAAFVEAQKWK